MTESPDISSIHNINYYIMTCVYSRYTVRSELPVSLPTNQSTTHKSQFPQYRRIYGPGREVDFLSSLCLTLAHTTSNEHIIRTTLSHYYPSPTIHFRTRFSWSIRPIWVRCCYFRKHAGRWKTTFIITVII